MLSFFPLSRCGSLILYRKKGQKGDSTTRGRGDKFTLSCIANLAVAFAVPDLEQLLLRFRSRMGARLPVCVAREQITRRIATAALSPRGHHVIHIAIARRPQRFDTFGRAVQAEFSRDGVGAGQIRVEWMNNPRGLDLTAGHERWLYATTIVIRDAVVGKVALCVLRIGSGLFIGTKDERKGWGG